ncbi:MAG: tRNA pseudouridine(38-40) synthase TruA [Planctomycetota bacterium]
MTKNKLRNIKLVIEYDGTNYCGWQIQKNGPTVQETLTKILTRITGHKITLYGTSRTDSGVHSIGQTANFLTTSRLTHYQFLRAINDQLPYDIVIRSVKEMPESFNSRYDAKSKIYRYTILNSLIPKVFDRNLYYFLTYRISIDRMKKAARYFIGKHNFRAFAAKSSGKEDCYRRIYSIKITKNKDYIYIDIKGDGFLYNMVRTIVGTLLWVSQGKMRPEDIKSIIKSEDRKNAGPTVPAKGLCLVKVNYELS